jgi:hypothetical protein
VGYFFDGLDDLHETPVARTSDESVDLIRTYYQLGERPRRRLLDMAKSLHTDSDAA